MSVPVFKKPVAADYAGAANYLSLLCSDKAAARYVKALRKARMIERAAKDLVRASGLALLPKDNAQVRKDLAKVRAGEPLATVLLVRGDLRQGEPLIVADGYHRICALYYLDPETMVPCRMAER